MVTQLTIPVWIMTVKDWPGQHLQFLRCLMAFYVLYIWVVFFLKPYDYSVSFSIDCLLLGLYPIMWQTLRKSVRCLRGSRPRYSYLLRLSTNRVSLQTENLTISHWETTASQALQWNIKCNGSVKKDIYILKYNGRESVTETNSSSSSVTVVFLLCFKKDQSWAASKWKHMKEK